MMHASNRPTQRTRFGLVITAAIATLTAVILVNPASATAAAAVNTTIFPPANVNRVAAAGQDKQRQTEQQSQVEHREAPPVTLLAGPEVKAASDAAMTIIDIGFDGALQSRHGEPATAAIALLDLDRDQQARFEQLRNERCATFDRAMRDNVELILELASNGEPYDDQSRQAQLRLFARVGQALAPYFDRGTMLEEMADVLTDEQQTQVQRLVDQYRTAHHRTIAKSVGGDVSDAEVHARAHYETIGTLIEQSIERIISIEQEEGDAFYELLGLTEKQKGQVEAIYQPYIVGALKGTLTEEDEQAIFAEIRELLTFRQKVKLYWWIAEQAVADIRDTWRSR